ncbi:MAG TPA: O-antigen ligase family protein [bacterium]|nr:O-antigen ligase family protein [bacterium]
MESSTWSRWSYRLLLFFAFATTASIAAQNAIWVAVLLWFFGRVRAGRKIDWPRGLFPIGAMELTLAELRKLLAVFVGGTFVCAVYGVWKHMAGIEVRISSFSGYYLIFGGLMMCALLIIAHFLIQNPRQVRYWAALVAIIPAFLLNETRGAWLAFAAGFAVLVWPKHRRLLAAGAVLALAGFFVLPGQLQQRVQSIADWKDQPRLFIWDAGVRIIKDYPVFGIGQGNLGDIYPKYVSPEAREREHGHLHDNYLQIQVQNGLFGSAAYLFWILAYFYAARRNAPAGGEMGSLNLLFVSLFAASLVWGLTQYTFAHQFMYFQAFLLGLQYRLWTLGKPSGSDPVQTAKA